VNDEHGTKWSNAAIVRLRPVCDVADLPRDSPLELVTSRSPDSLENQGSARTAILIRDANEMAIDRA